MKKHTDRFKQAAVARMQNGEETIKAVAAKLKVDPSTLRMWRAKLGGKKNGHPPAVRAKALKLIAAGVTQKKVAERLKVSSAIVHYWRTMENKKGKQATVKEKSNGAEVERRDVRDAMVFFNKALKIAATRGLNVAKDQMLLNVAYGVSLLEGKM